MRYQRKGLRRRPLTVLLLIEQRWYDLLANNEEANLPYSHDQHLLQLGHEALRKGYDVYFAPIQFDARNKEALSIQQFYPVMRFQRVRQASKINAVADFVVFVYAHILDVRKDYPKAKSVCILPAINFLEQQEGLPATWTHNFFLTARTQVDFFLTQNYRMADLAHALLLSFARINVKDRILVCPLGIPPEQTRHHPPRTVIRKHMGLKPDEIAFINAGGPWNWTDYNSFLKAFCQVVEKGTTNIKFYVMGFKQTNNFDHEEYIAQTKSIIQKHRHLVGKNLIVFDDWEEASKVVVAYVHAADVGVNANRDTAENWQSYRLRFLEYMKAGLPVINTTGDYLSAHEASGAVYPVQTGNIQSYEKAIREAATDHKGRAARAAAMRSCAQKFSTQNTYGNIFDKLIPMDRRNFADPSEVYSPALFNPTFPDLFEDTPVRLRSAFVRADDGLPRRPGAKHWAHAKKWKPGTGAFPYDFPELQANDKAVGLGFTIKVTSIIKSIWNEVLQIGPNQREARLLLCTTYRNDKNFVISISMRDQTQGEFVLATPPIALKKRMKVAFHFVPSKGLVYFWLDNLCYRAHTPAPWSWQSTDKLWLGSRRLDGSIGEFWIECFAPKEPQKR